MMLSMSETLFGPLAAADAGGSMLPAWLSTPAADALPVGANPRNADVWEDEEEEDDDFFDDDEEDDEDDEFFDDDDEEEDDDADEDVDV